MLFCTIKSSLLYLLIVSSFLNFKLAGEKEVHHIDILKNDGAPNVTGTWRVYSERIFYDVGGAGAIMSASGGNATTLPLIIKEDGTYNFGTNHGKLTIENIQEPDWKVWRAKSYGPTRKIVLTGWSKEAATVSGPLEERDGRVNFIWVVYHVSPPIVLKAGNIDMKFGH